MVGTLETLSPNLLGSLGASRLGEALATPQAKAAVEAAVSRQAATPATTRAPERDRTPDHTRSADHDHDRDNDDRVRVEISAAATRLTQSGQPPAPPPAAAMETLRSLRRAREAKQEGPLDEGFKVRVAAYIERTQFRRGAPWTRCARTARAST
jgi:hypothetical protein